MSYDWTMFFNEFAADFHPSFQKELSRQLFEKGYQTGIEKFKEHNLQLIVGMDDLKIRQAGNRVYATIAFIAPTSFAFLVEIYWESEDPKNILDIHKHDISNIRVEFNWGENFPLQQILPHLVDTERFD